MNPSSFHVKSPLTEAAEAGELDEHAPLPIRVTAAASITHDLRTAAWAAVLAHHVASRFRESGHQGEDPRQAEAARDVAIRHLEALLLEQDPEKPGG